MVIEKVEQKDTLQFPSDVQEAKRNLSAIARFCACRSSVRAHDHYDKKSNLLKKERAGVKADIAIYVLMEERKGQLC